MFSSKYIIRITLIEGPAGCTKGQASKLQKRAALRPALLRNVLFYHQDAGGNRSAGAIVPMVEHSVTWHDAIQRKKVTLSVTCCPAHGVMVRFYGCYAKVGDSTLALPTFFSFFLYFFPGSA